MLIHSKTYLSIHEGIEEIQDYCNEHFEQVQVDFNLMDLNQEYLDFSSWLSDLLKSFPLPEQVVAINFGLFEVETGIQMYLTGSFEWNVDDADWACNSDYSPEGRYIELRIFRFVHQIMEQNYWAGIFFALSIVILFVKKYFFEHKKDLLSGRDQSLHIATGFDDGDLYNILNLDDLG